MQIFIQVINLFIIFGYTNFYKYLQKERKKKKMNKKIENFETNNLNIERKTDRNIVIIVVSK